MASWSCCAGSSGRRRWGSTTPSGRASGDGDRSALGDRDICSEMGALVRWLFLLALGLWLGEVVFFSFVVAPSVFRSVPPLEAGRVVGAIFPRYYLLGIACGAV